MSKQTIELECTCCKGTGKIKETVWIRNQPYTCEGCFAADLGGCQLGYRQSDNTTYNPWRSHSPAEPCPRPVRERLFLYLKSQEKKDDIK